MPDLDGF